MNLEEIENIFKKEFPKEFCTLSASGLYSVDLSGDFLIISAKKKSYNIGLEYFYSLLVEVISYKSFVNSLYEGRFNKLFYLLPIVKFIIIESGDDIALYNPPVYGWKKCNKEKIKSNCEKDKSTLHTTYSQAIILDDMEYFVENKRITPSDIFHFTYNNSIHHLNIDSEERLSNKKENIRTDKEFILSDIFYVTNRKPSGNLDIYSGEINTKTQYGMASISIPKNIHKSGVIERPLSFWKLSFKENEKKHFIIKESKEIVEADFFTLIDKESQKKSIMIFIHGFNVNFKDALFKSAQLKYDLDYQCPFILFSWPSKGKVHAYAYDSDNAINSASVLYNLLVKVQSMNIDEVNIVAHSMGTFCLSEAIKYFDDQNNYIFNRLALAAPDLNIHAYKHDYSKRLVKIFEKISLYVSSSDKALIASNLVHQLDRVGYSKNEVIVTTGIDTIDMSNLDHGLFSLNHSYISEKNGALNDLHQFLINNISVNKRRLIKLFDKIDREYWAIRS